MTLARGAAFYESQGQSSGKGRDFSPSPVGRLGLYLARRHFLWRIQRALPAGSTVADLGCGQGSRYLARRYQVVGVDWAAAGVARAKGSYSRIIQGDTSRLPLAASSVDGVVSTFLLEHLAPAAALAEMARVLRPGGVMLHLFNPLADGPFDRWARRHAWYEPIYVERLGHDSLLPLHSWQVLLQEAGFTVEATWPHCQSPLQDASVWAALDDPAAPPRLRRVGRLAQAFHSRGGAALDAALTLFDDAVAWVAPVAWASKVTIQARRYDASTQS